MNRREYDIPVITINKKQISKVIIDPHYEIKHKRDINDPLILELVNKLDGILQIPESVDERFSYFVSLIIHHKKQYRVIWLLEDNEIYIGIVNTFRDRKGK